MQTAVLSTGNQVLNDVRTLIRKTEEILETKPYAKDAHIAWQCLMDLCRLLEHNPSKYSNIAIYMLSDVKKKILPKDVIDKDFNNLFTIAHNVKFCRGSKGVTIFEMLRECRNKVLAKNKNLYWYLVAEKNFKSENYPSGHLQELSTWSENFKPNYEDHIAIELWPTVTLADVEDALKEFFEKGGWIFKKDFQKVITAYDPSAMDESKTLITVSILRLEKNNNPILFLTAEKFLSSAIN